MPLDYAGIAHIFAQAPSQPVTETPPVQQTTPAQSVHDPVHEHRTTSQPQQVPENETGQQVVYPSSLPQALTDLMMAEQVTPDELVAVANIRGHFPPLTPIENFPPDYWNMIVANWGATLEVIKTQVRSMEPPFTVEGS
ncbi:phage protein [Streptococcus agalactiae]|nr:phage protein [Streptococcus agalactiae]CNG61036.1 phage protein [Streptococcus agalactiae]